MPPNGSGEVVTLNVRHNIEIAHRLFTLPGKCQNIHGHSVKVIMYLICDLENGYAMATDGTPLEFGSVKKEFRGYLDEVWDHHLHLSADDPWTELLMHENFIGASRLPGLQRWPGDPSTENIARWIYDECEKLFGRLLYAIELQETDTNGVTYSR